MQKVKLTIQRNDRGFWTAAPFCPNLDLKASYQKYVNQHDRMQNTLLIYSVEMSQLPKTQGIEIICHILEKKNMVDDKKFTSKQIS